MFTVLKGQCRDLVRTKLESKKWVRIDKDSDAVELLKLIKVIAFRYESQSYQFQTVCNSMRSLYVLSQGEVILLELYLDSFLNITNSINHSNGFIGENPNLHKYLLKLKGKESTKNSSDIEAAEDNIREAYLAYVLISGANQSNYAKL
eukprot:3994569-Ditylum_brightwellii.AAC.1